AELAVIGAEGVAPAQQEEPTQPAQSAQEQPAQAPAPAPSEPPAAQQAPQSDRQAAQPSPVATTAVVQPDQPAQGAEPEAVPRSTDGGTTSEGDGSGGKYVTPLVRKLAAEHGIDLSTLRGTGVGGRIRKQDVLEAAEAKKAAAAAPAEQPAATAPSAAAAPTVEPSPLRGTTEKLSRMRK